MDTITVLPNDPRDSVAPFRAVSGNKQAVGSTVGQAIDELRAELGEQQGTTLVIVQPMTPDVFFTAEQRERLSVLMGKWRLARDSGVPFPPEEQRELDALVDAELCGAAARAAHLLGNRP